MNAFQFIAIIATSLVVAPYVCLLSMYRAGGRPRLEGGLRWFGAMSALLFLILVGRWDVVGVWWLYLLVLAAAVLTLRLCLELRSHPWLPDRFGRRQAAGWAVEGSTGVILACLCIWLVAGYVAPDKNGLKVSWPLETANWAVVHGGDNSLINAHQSAPSQGQALDIVGLNRFGARAAGILPSRVEDYSIYGAAVRSPCDGEVLSIRDGLPDQPVLEMATERLAGNHVVIACGNASVLLAHLRRGSIEVRPGTRVHARQPIAEVGNSGRSSEPHLHIQAVRGRTSDIDDHIEKGDAVPLIFGGGYLTRGDHHWTPFD